MTDTPAPVVTYWGISILNSRTFWFGVATFASGLLSLPDVAALIPLRYLPAVLSIVGFLIVYLRTVTVRPVAFIAPGATAPVAVPKIVPPAPPLVGD
jgi:hypothetical protein